jgi:hypothetical protein
LSVEGQGSSFSQWDSLASVTAKVFDGGARVVVLIRVRSADGPLPRKRGISVVWHTVGGSKRLVFLSFDVERDRKLRDYFLTQGRHNDATWYVRHWSGPYDETDPMWVSTTTGHVQHAEAVVVMMSPSTFRAKGVLKEISIAKELGRPVFQIVPESSGRPHLIPGIGPVIWWEWQAVKRAIAGAARRADSRSAY